MSMGLRGRVVLSDSASRDHPLLVPHLLGEVGEQPCQISPRLALGERAQPEHHLVDGAVVILDEHGVEQLDEDVLEQLHVIHASLHHQEDGAHELGKQPRALLLGDLLLQAGLELVRGVVASHHQAAHLLHAIELGVQVLGVEAGEAQVVVRVRLEARVQVAHHLIHLDLHLVLGHLVHLEALDHHVLEVLEARAPQLGEHVLGAALGLGQGDEGEGDELLEREAGAEDELADAVAEELVGQRRVLGEEGLAEDHEVLLLDFERQRAVLVGVGAQGLVGAGEELGELRLVVSVHANLLDGLEQLEGEGARRLHLVLHGGVRRGLGGGGGGLYLGHDVLDAPTGVGWGRCSLPRFLGPGLLGKPGGDGTTLEPGPRVWPAGCGPRLTGGYILLRSRLIPRSRTGRCRRPTSGSTLRGDWGTWRTRWPRAPSGPTIGSPPRSVPCPRTEPMWCWPTARTSRTRSPSSSPIRESSWTSPCPTWAWG